MKKNILILSLCVSITPADATAQQKWPGEKGTTLEKNFKAPPLTARPKALWPWVNGNFSLSQITYEMEQAKLKGMGGLDIWDVGTTIDENRMVPDGPPFLSDASLHGIRHAVEEGDRLGLEIGLVSSSSWNAGGSWIKPEHGAMGLYRKDTIVTGPGVFNASLPFPQMERARGGHSSLMQFHPLTGLPVYYKEVALLAHPVRDDSTIGDTLQVIQLSNPQNVIDWTVPAGKWRIVRYVCAPTGQPLVLPSPKSNGLMVDHFSAVAQQANLDYIFGRLKKTLGSLKGRSLKYIYEDSYEVNSAVWTPLLPEEFQERAGYSLLPFLPVLDGFVVGTIETTGRFGFDFTKVLSDLIIENHYAEGKRESAKEGLGFYAEAGGPGKPIHNVPFEDLKALGSLTVPRGEFWNKHEDLEKLQIIKGISSAAHIYNQRYVEAEAFTSVWLWQEGPGELKPLADRAMCEGLNRFVYHTFPHTPPESGRPGWAYNFGTLINTTNGWWPKSEGFHQYLARCSYLLQQGEFVGDVAFYYGDVAPNFVPPKHVPSTLGPGYDYDVVNSDVILNKMTVRNGRIYLPHGQFYEVLVLPDDQRMNPLVLQKLEKMAAAGATIIGPKPQQAYSLHQQQKSDQQIRTVAAKLWGRVDSSNVQEQVYGKGKIVWGKTVRDVLKGKGIFPDLSFETAAFADSIDYIHRRTRDADIYFIRNKGTTPIAGTCAFRVSNKQPEWWDAETGNTGPITLYSNSRKGTSLPVSLPAQASAFIIFKDPQVKRKGVTEAFASNLLYTSKGLVAAKAASSGRTVLITDPWELRFEHKGDSPIADTMQVLHSWHKSADPGIKYFSGQVTYRNSFDLSRADLKGGEAVLLLALNTVKEIADVYLNGKKLGQHWHPARVFALKEELVPGKNHLVIEVVNSINNGLVGDAKLPAPCRQSRSNISRLPNAWMNPFGAAPLLEAGLIGPVTLRWASIVQ